MWKADYIANFFFPSFWQEDSWVARRVLKYWLGRKASHIGEALARVIPQRRAKVTGKSSNLIPPCHSPKVSA